MASWPGTRKAYPVTPKAYPASPKAYPGALSNFPGGAPTFEDSIASAAVGVFSTVNYWDRSTGVMPDLVPGSTIIFMARMIANSGNECHWGCCAAANGWHVTASGGAGGRLDLYMRGGANPFYPLNGGAAAPLDYFCVCITRKADGSLRSSTNGLALATPSASPAYVALDGTSIETIGRVNPAVNTFAAVQGNFIACAYVRREATDAEVQAWAGQITATNCFELHPDIRAYCAANPTTSYEFHFARDWDGSAATATAGLGAANVFTKHGTGGTKNILPAFRRYRFATKLDLKNCDLFETGIVGQPAGFYQGNHFASTKFTTTATHVIFDINARNNGSLNDADSFGIEVAGVPDNYIQRMWGFDVPQIYSRTGMSSSSKTVEGINNYHEFSPTGVGGTIKGGIGVSITGVRLPVASPPTFDLAVPSALLMYIGNSMSGKVVGGNGTLNGSTNQAFTMLARRNIRASSVPAWANGDLIADGWGGRNGHDIFQDAPTRAEWIARQVAALRGTSKNVVCYCEDINDYILNSYSDLNLYKSDFGAYLDGFKTAVDAAGVPGFTFYLITSQPKTDESAVGGHTAQDLRDASTAVGTDPARSAWVNVIQGPTMTDTTDLGDGLHFSAGGTGAPSPAKGHVHMEASLRAIVVY